MEFVCQCEKIKLDSVGQYGPVAFAPSLVRLAGNAGEMQVQETMSK